MSTIDTMNDTDLAQLRARLAEIENFLNECKKEDLDRYATGDLNGNVCEGRLQLADDLLSVLEAPGTAHAATLRARLEAPDTAHVATLRARLAAAEAVIAALPKCDWNLDRHNQPRNPCNRVAISVQYDDDTFDEDGFRVHRMNGYACDEHYPEEPLPYAAQLRAYLALVETTR